MEKLYKLLSMQGESIVIELFYGITKFRSMSIKPYFIDKTSINDNQPILESFISTPIQAFTIKAFIIKKKPNKSSFNRKISNTCTHNIKTISIFSYN